MQSCPVYFHFFFYFFFFLRKSFSCVFWKPTFRCRRKHVQSLTSNIGVHTEAPIHAHISIAGESNFIKITFELTILEKWNEKCWTKAFFWNGILKQTCDNKNNRWTFILAHFTQYAFNIFKEIMIVNHQRYLQYLFFQPVCSFQMLNTGVNCPILIRIQTFLNHQMFVKEKILQFFLMVHPCSRKSAYLYVFRMK